jgi:hypothetical protein
MNTKTAHNIEVSAIIKSVDDADTRYDMALRHKEYDYIREHLGLALNRLKMMDGMNVRLTDEIEQVTAVLKSVRKIELAFMQQYADSQE